MVAVVAGAAVGARAWFSSAPVKTTRPAAGIVHRRVIGRGEIEAVGGIAKMRSRVDGRVTRVLVREGDRVAGGQVIATIDDPVLDAEVARLQSERDARRQLEATVSQGARNEERAALAADVRTAEAELALAEDRLRRTAALSATGSISDAERVDAEAAAGVAKARLDAARARRDLATNGPRQSDVRSAKNESAAASAAEVEMERRLEMTRIEAPFDGVVVARHIDEGETVTGAESGQGQLLFEIADDTRQDFRVEVESIDAELIALDQDVEIRTPGGLARLGSGKVTRMGARLSERTIGVASSRERAEGWVRNVWVSISWDRPQERHPLGERLEGHIALPSLSVATSLPRDAIDIHGGRAVVHAAAFLGWREIPVVLGESDDRTVEVRGLDARTVVRLRE
jgi:multidrug efflux pump subunit AcrA (membrane-fusion protein)